MLVAAQVNRDAQIKVVSMSPAILVWYQIVTSCNLLVLVFKTVNCNKAVYIDMYFQFYGWHKCCQCCLGAACDQGGHQMTPFVVPTQVHTLVWSCFVLPEHHFCDQGSSNVSCRLILQHCVEPRGGNQRDGRRIAKRPTTDAAKDRETSRTSIALLSFVSTVMNIFARGILVIENSFLQILQKARQMMQINCDLEFFGIFCIGWCLGCCGVNMYYISIWW